MTRPIFLRWTLASAAAMLAVSLSVSGCGQPPDQFIIIQDQVPDSACVVPTSKSATYRWEGVLDVALVAPGQIEGYMVFPLLQNNLPAPTGGDGADPNRIALSSYEIVVSAMDDAPDAVKAKFATLQTSGTNGEPDGMIQYSIPTSGSVSSGGGNTSSGVNGVPGDLARTIHASGVLAGGANPPFHLESTIRAVGSTTTRTVTSDPFHFPIEVCDGCLIGNAIDGKIPVCPVTAAPNLGNACNVAQDEVVDCCTTNAGELVCPPVVATP